MNGSNGLADQPPIFILGMLQRTGTNHLWDLFGLHPDTDVLDRVPEDHLVRWSPHLVAYVDDVTRCWSEEWEAPAGEGDALLRALGGGVVDWLRSHSERRIVTKMPSVEQAHRFFDLFPGCPLVILVRDGRNVCESGVRSFGWSYERAFRRWSMAADIVLEIQRAHQGRSPLAIVRYEDIFATPHETMRRLCAATGLDADRYPYDEIDRLPVRGSSTITSDGTEVHWTPVERTATFDPSERWSSWDDHRHRRFAEVAGEQQLALGYELVEASGTDSIGQRLRDARDLADVRARELRVKVGRARRAVRRVHGRI